MKTYTIKKGRHYSNHLPKLVYGMRNLSTSVKFHSDCWFPLSQPDDYAINKLVGWSMGYHHTSSIRCGWRPAGIPGYIDLFFYTYCQGYRHDEYFTTIECDKEFLLFMLISSDGDITFSASGKSVTLKGPCIGKKLGYLLFPYFGGKNTAPHDIHIDIDIK